jgi:hypothetical protein
MNMGAIQLNQTKSGRVVLSNHTDQRITIKKIEISRKDITTDIPVGKVLEPNSHTPVGATIKSSEEGTISGKITFITDSKQYPKAVIDVRGIVGQEEK